MIQAVRLTAVGVPVRPRYDRDVQVSNAQDAYCAGVWNYSASKLDVRTPDDGTELGAPVFDPPA